MFNRMHIYTVHRKPDAEMDDVQFVREGFSLWAFLLVFLWAFYQRAWVWGFALLAVEMLLWGMVQQGWLAVVSMNLLHGGLQLLAGFEGNDWERERLRRQGYALVDVVTAENKLCAGRRFFDRLLALRGHSGS